MTGKEKLLYLRYIQRIVIDVYPVEYAHHHIEIERNGNVVFHKHGDRFSTQREKCGPYFDGIIQESIVELLFSDKTGSKDTVDKRNAFEWRIAFYTPKGCLKKCTGFIPHGEFSDSPFVYILSWVEKCLDMGFGLQYLKSGESASCVTEVNRSNDEKTAFSLDGNQSVRIGQFSKKILMSAAKRNEMKNSVVSPVSILIVLSVLIRITKGDSQKELTKMLMLDPHEAWDIAAQLNSAISADSRMISSANALYIKDHLINMLNPEMLPLLSTALGLHKFNSPCTASDINRWVSNKTNGMITRLVNAISDFGDISFINALCFMAKWEKEYKEWNIEDGEFHALDGSIQEVSMLKSTEKQYLSNEYAYGFIKPYKNCDYSFTAILPRQTQDPYEMLQTFRHDDALIQLISRPIRAIVDVTIPEFGFDYNVSVKDILKDHGIHSVFDPEQADLSELISLSGTHISDIVHKARIEVNRNGTRAAAVTAMMAIAGCVPRLDHYEVVLDRPFIFGIINNQTSIPLFLGIVNKI